MRDTASVPKRQRALRLLVKEVLIGPERVDAVLRRINAYLARWLREKFKRLRPFNKAKACRQRMIRQDPGAFAHWAWVLWF